MSMVRKLGRFVALTLILLYANCRLPAQTSSPAQPTISSNAQQEPPPNESDPTKAVFASLRSEYSNLINDGWSYALVYRMDHAWFNHRGYPGGKLGLLTRFDLPVVTAHVGGETHAGLGDIFLQALWVPKINQRFALALGSGFILPTATHRTLGSGKWQVVPAILPVWFLPNRKGLFFVKLSNQVSVAGDGSRADVNSFSMQPLLLYQFRRRWWLILDNEAKIDWNNDYGMSCRSAFEVGRVMTPRFGFSVKPEFPWGNRRQADWTLKFILTWYKPPG